MVDTSFKDISLLYFLIKSEAHCIMIENIKVTKHSCSEDLSEKIKT